MQTVKVSAFTISLDGFGAGPDQSLEHPLGIGGTDLHAWLLPTRTFEQMNGRSGGTTGVDDEFAREAMANVGAWIMGRNMFGPIRGEWPDRSWRGWWGEDPPYQTDVFVLTHHPREPLPMEGGTTFHFVTGGIHEALERARAAAGDKHVRIGGGVATVRQYLKAGLVDELHLVVSPVVLGGGEHLLHGLDLRACGLEHVRYVPSETAAHHVLTRTKPGGG